MKKTNNKGFSLVELIVVIAIMAVLIGVLAPTFTKYVERSRKSTDVQNASAIVTAIQTYAADPMVTTDKLADGATVVLKYNAAPAFTGNADKACAAAGVEATQLKSDKWGGDITLTVTVNATTGAVTVASTGESAGQNIITGKYE